MEALPTVPMLAPQFRTSTLTYDNIARFDFRTKVKEYILLHFQADPHAYDQAFRELSDMKHEANNPTETIESTCSLKRYFGQLCMLQKRFPMSAGQELETPFAWFDSLCDNRHPSNEITHGDIEFEKASVMFNIGAVHAQIAALENRGDQDSIKHAFMHFQYAAYAFERLRNERYEDIFYPSVDLDPQVVSFFEKLMLAQAQECLVQKSLLDNRSPIVIGKLAYWLYQVYEEMINICEDWNVNISERIQRVYIGICRVKMDMYATIAYLSMGDNAEAETKKMGYRLQYYNIALKYMNNIMRIKGLSEHHPEFLLTVSFLNDVVTAKQVNADKENNFIYHERVPKEEELIEEMKKDGAMCKTKSLAFNPLDRSVCGDDIFGTLLPPTVLKSVSLYEEKKAELKRGVLQEVHHADQELESFLNKAGYTDLRWMLSDDGKDNEKMFALPDMLLERNAELTAQPDSIPALLEKLRESADTSRIAEAKLNTLIGKLRAIDLPRLKNDEGYTLILKELDKLHEHLTNAKSNNVSLNKAIAAHSSNLQILSLPMIELRQKLLPKKKDLKSTSKEEQHLKRVMDKIEEMKNQRSKLLTQLEVELNQDDISKELLAERDFSHDEIFKKELAKHDETIKYFRLNLTAQEKILHAFTEANADFCDERMLINESSEEFNKQVMILVTAYDIYKDVCNKVADGEKFYRQLMQRCDQFAVPIHAIEEQYRVEVEKREREQREVEEHRRMREARSALNEFGAPSSNPVYSPMTADAGHPRLRDYMDQYRNRSKLAPVQTDQQSEHLPGPPSPTPSSINEFPISPSVRGSRAASIRDTPILSQHSPNPQRYTQQPLPTPPPPPQGYGQPHQFQHAPNSQFHPPYHQPTPQNYQPQYQAPPDQSQYRPSPIQSTGSTSSLGSLANQQYTQQQYSAPPAQYSQQQQHPQYQPTPPPPTSTPYGQYQYNSNPPTMSQPMPGSQSQFQPPGNVAPPNVGPPPSQTNPVPSHPASVSGIPPQLNHTIPSGNVGAPIAQAPYQPNSIVPGGAPIGNLPVSPPNQFNGHPLQHGSSNVSANVSGPSNHFSQNSIHGNLGAQSQYQSAPGSTHHPIAGVSQYQQSNIPGPVSNTTFVPQHFNPNGTGMPPQFNQTHQLPLTPSGANSFNSTAALSGNLPQPMAGTLNPSVPPSGMSQFNPAARATTPDARVAPTSPFSPNQFQTPTPTSPYQGNVTTSPFQPATQSQVPLAQNSNSQQLQPNSGTASPFQQAQSSRFSPNQSAPQIPQQGFNAQPKPTSPFNQQPPQGQQSSPWHQSPAQLQTSAWHHAQNQQQQQQQQVAQPQAPQQQQQPPRQSNVDLLSDLLGDFNLQQPALQPVQHQKQSNPDFHFTPSPAAPDKKAKPAAAVLPMPQAAVNPQQVPEDQPILSMNMASSVSFHQPSNPLPIGDLTDPTKFEMGAGNAQKLEKRMLHQSIRTNGPLPPLDPSDPLNQIDAFGTVPR